MVSWRRVEPLLRIAGVIGPLLLLLVILADGATRPGYSPWSHGVSQLTLGDRAGWERATYVICGLLVLGFGGGVGRRTAGAPGGKWGPWLVGAIGAGLVVAGIFPTDPALGYPPGEADVVTVSGRLHQVGGSLLFIGLIGGCFVLARYFGHRSRRGWRLLSIVVGVAVSVTAMAAGLLYRLATVNDVTDAPVGALELTAFVLGFGWLAMVAWRGDIAGTSGSARERGGS